jgi:hypothetical protein
MAARASSGGAGAAAAAAAASASRRAASSASTSSTSRALRHLNRPSPALPLMLPSIRTLATAVRGRDQGRHRARPSSGASAAAAAAAAGPPDGLARRLIDEEMARKEGTWVFYVLFNVSSASRSVLIDWSNPFIHTQRQPTPGVPGSSPAPWPCCGGTGKGPAARAPTGRRS